jgi:hypothetical protein
MALMAIGSFAGVVLSVGYRQSGETKATVEQNQAMLAAQAGANAAVAALTTSLANAQDESVMGTEEAPIAFSGAEYWSELESSGDVHRLLTHGRSGRQERTIEVVFQASSSEGPFQSAVFAGNSSGDSAYTMTFGGTGTQADYVTGNIYSGGSVAFTGDATVSGSVHAANSATGVSDPEVGVTRPIPDLAAQNYSATANFDVASIFAAQGTYASNSKLGGSAWQVPATSAAHIFRKNPSDRTANTSTTTKDDYFLEDPHEANSSSSLFKISLSGVNGASGEDSNQKIFYIDGNLWLHNHPCPKFQIVSGTSGVQVTFVVKGNVYLSDDFVYTSEEKDGVAFIAMKDPAVSDSGNIYFGDPVYGTLDYMQGFMYAENNFYDNNLVSTAGGSVELFGNMTAGNQVLINRDKSVTKKGKTTIYHTLMGIEFDERLANGALTLPGIPDSYSEEGSEMTVLTWREAGND